MKKNTIFKIDRNTEIDNYLTSSMLPYQNATSKKQTNVKIIELDDSNTSDSDEYALNYDRRHAWCYVDKKRPQKDEKNYKVNIKARERRRMVNRVYPVIVNNDLRYENCDFTYPEPVPTASNSTWSNVAKERTVANNPLNCFTIINNELADSDQSLSDTDDGLKIIQCGDVVLEGDSQSNSIYSTEQKNHNVDLNSSKRTIWIYSIKNRNVLSEDVAMLENASSVDSTSSSSIENFGSKTDYRDKMTSPIPASIIPRLNFYVAATLPPVTEVTEPLHITTPDNTDNTIKITPKSDKPHRLLDRTHPAFSHSSIPSRNIINWMGLSPRERRRKLKMPDLVKENNLTEDILKYDSDELKSSSISKEINNCLHQKSDTDRELTFVIAKNNEGKDNETISLEINNDQLQVNLIDEKGDHNKIKLLKKPQIRLKRIHAKETSDPIEQLNEDRWIGPEIEYRLEKKTDIDAKDTGEVHAKPEKIIKCAADRLLNRNMSLLKPVEWSQYLPITESMPSLHLSLPSDINEEKQSWFKYIIKYLQCCKMCK